MKHNDLDVEYYAGTVSKAGVIPYYFENGKVLMQFMVSSDFKFGGAKPQVCKGEVEQGEDLKTAGIREAGEELGLRLSNIIEVGEPLTLTDSKSYKLPKEYDGNFSGMLMSYDTETTIYPVKVQSRARKDFDKPHFETKFTLWWPIETFRARGRKDQVPFAEYVYKYALAHK